MKIDVKNSADIQELNELISSLEEHIDVLISINNQIEDLKQKYRQNAINVKDCMYRIKSKFNLSNDDILELHEINIVDRAENDKKKYYDKYGDILKDLQEFLDTLLY